jgi:hypothetical protein
MAPLKQTLTTTRPAGSRTKPVDRRSTRVGVDERAGERGDSPGVGAVPDQKGQAVPGDQLGSGGFVVH